MNNQLIFKFPSYKNYSKEDYFVSSSNYDAFKLIDTWPKWIKRELNIYGPTGSGKTHLMSIFKSKTSCLEVTSKNLSENIFANFKVKESIVVEDLDDNVKENILYSLFNIAQQDNKYIILTSEKPLSNYSFKLPDLRSRVNSCPSIEIKMPNDELIKVILAKNFSDKQIIIDKKHIDFIIQRIDRSYDKVSKFALMLDDYSLEKGKPFNLKIIKEVLNKL